MKSKSLQTKKASILLLIALVCSYAFVCLTRNCFSSAMVFIVDEGYLTSFETGIITATFYLVYAVLQVAGGIITDKWHPEHLITIGLVGGGFCNLIIFFNQSYPVMLVAWALNAVFQLGVWPATFKLVSTTLHKDMRTSSLFIVTFSNPLGVVASYLVSAFVNTQWRLNFLISAVGLFILAPAFEMVIRRITPDLADDISLLDKSNEKSSNSKNTGFLSLAFGSGLAIILVIAFIRTGFDLGLKSVTPLMIKQSYERVTPVLATLLNIIVLVAGALGTVIAYIVYPKHVKNESIVIAVFFSIALPLTVASLLLGSISYWWIVIFMSLIVMLMGATSLFTTSYIAARFNKWGKGATVAGILNCASSLGIVAANALFTGLSESIGWHGVVVVWVITMSTATLLSFVVIPLWTKFIK